MLLLQPNIIFVAQAGPTQLFLIEFKYKQNIFTILYFLFIIAAFFYNMEKTDLNNYMARNIDIFIIHQKTWKKDKRLVRKKQLK